MVRAQGAGAIRLIFRALRKCGNAFDDLRYHYEDPDETVFYLGELPKVLVGALGELKPEWLDRGTPVWG